MGGQLNSYRQLIGLGDVPDVTEGFDAPSEVMSVNGQVEVAVIAGLLFRQQSHTPAASDPVANARVVQGIEYLCDLVEEHIVTVPT